MSQSDAFKAMLTHNTKEAHDKLVQIEKVKAPVMDAFIHHLYLAEIPIQGDDLIEGLYVLADKYLVTDLKVTCCR